jgi:UMP-CMP kinase
LNYAHKWVHLSAGDLLRAERQNKGSALADEINACIAAGKLVASEVTCKLLENAMLQAYQTNGSMHFLIDGFPRSQSNADAWEVTMSQHCQIVSVLDFCCPEETLIGRLLERGKSSGRSDDNLATVKARFETFQNETAPILDYYRNHSQIPVYTIATDKPVEAVYQDTVQYFIY